MSRGFELEAFASQDRELGISLPAAEKAAVARTLHADWLCCQLPASGAGGRGKGMPRSFAENRGWMINSPGGSFLTALIPT